MTSPAKVAQLIEERGEDAEGWNYHENAEFLRNLAAEVRAGTFNLGSPHLMGGVETVLRWVVKNIEAGPPRPTRRS